MTGASIVVNDSVFEYPDSLAPSLPLTRQKNVVAYGSEPSDIVVWPLPLTGTVTIASICVKSALRDTSK